jgi:UDP-N-acetylmuramate dehydrogenase
MKKRFDNKTLTSNLSIGYLRNYSHMRICENVGYLLAPKSVDELAGNILFATDLGKPIMHIGGASNILFGNCENVVMIMDAMMPGRVEFNKTNVFVSANYNINLLIMKAAKLGLGGLEFLAGIPAHFGGLVKMNAGAWGKEISSFVKRVQILERSGTLRWLSQDDISWDYRSSSITDCIVAAELVLIPNNKDDIRSNVVKNIAKRNMTQPLQLPNLGCIFKNPSGFSAGKLIDECGLKGTKIGDAEISNKHANMFVNSGNATFSQMWKLIELAKKEVEKKWSIQLEMEIEVIHS